MPINNPTATGLTYAGIPRPSGSSYNVYTPGNSYVVGSSANISVLDFTNRSALFIHIPKILLVMFADLPSTYSATGQNTGIITGVQATYNNAPGNYTVNPFSIDLYYVYNPGGQPTRYLTLSSPCGNVPNAAGTGMVNNQYACAFNPLNIATSALSTGQCGLMGYWY